MIFQTRPQGYRNSLFSKQFSRGDVLNNLKTQTEEIKEESESSDDSNAHDSASYEPTRNSGKRATSQDIAVTQLDDNRKSLGELMEIADDAAVERVAHRKKKKKKRRKKLSRLQTEYFEDEEEDKEGEKNKNDSAFSRKHNTIEPFNLDRIVEMLSHLGNEDDSISMEESTM